MREQSHVNEKVSWQEHLERAALRLGFTLDAAGVPDLLAIAQEKGWTANLWLPPGPTFPPPLPPVEGGRLVLREKRLVLRPGILFTFRVVLQGDLRQEELAQVLVDLWDEWLLGGEGLLFPPGVLQGFPLPERFYLPREKVRPRSLSRPAPSFSALTSPVTETWETEEEHFASGQVLRRAYPLFRAYRLACRHLLESLSPRTARLEAETTARKERELTRLQAYYQEREKEITAPLGKIIHQVAVAQVMAGLAKTPSTRARYEAELAAKTHELEQAEQRCRRALAELAQEARRRLGEVERHYRFQVRLSLMAVANVYLPYLSGEVSFQPSSTGEEGRWEGWGRPVHALLCPPEGIWVDLTCGACGERLTGKVAVLGKKGEVWCQECVCRCRLCGEPFPQGEGLSCHLCGWQVCPGCGQACFLGHTACTVCASRSCRGCRALREWGIGLN